MQHLLCKNKQTMGFTLVELVIVIVLIGILSGVATIKFIDFKHQALVAKMAGIKAAIATASDLVHNACLVNQTSATNPCSMIGNSSVLVNGATVNTVQGYATSDENGIMKAINLDRTALSVNPFFGALAIIPNNKDAATASFTCVITYSTSPLTDPNAAPPFEPIIYSNFDGC